MPSGTAPGYRTHNTGTLNGIGDHGCYWSVATNSIYGLHLHFYVASIHPTNPNLRACGFQLRCLSE
ncbi:hypothetical protein [uncultured Rikenella sp.]|uniref:hypothetical protein n=1 Tax=uncultured Rikenella sp. TaxID=368003 RepID=UPI002614C33E|nr:hypothetical protein [uncultured Rikenella sp.]